MDPFAQHTHGSSRRLAAASKHRKPGEPSRKRALVGPDAEQLGTRDSVDHFRMPMWDRRRCQMVSRVERVAAARTDVAKLLPRAQHLSDRFNWIGKNPVAFQSAKFGNRSEFDLQRRNFKSHYTIFFNS